jgi:hypothetical protein
MNAGVRFFQANLLVLDGGVGDRIKIDRDWGATVDASLGVFEQTLYHGGHAFTHANSGVDAIPGSAVKLLTVDVLQQFHVVEDSAEWLLEIMGDNRDEAFQVSALFG